MAEPTLLYLSQAEVIGLEVSMGSIIEVVEAAFREHAAGRYENPPKPGVHPLDDAFIHAMPSWLPGLGALGIKWVSGFSSNPANGLPAITGLLVMNDVKTGFPEAIMDCAWLTAVRTAAVSAAAIKVLVRDGSKVAAIAGTGVQGNVHLDALREVLPGLDTVKLYDPDTERLNALIAKKQPDMPFTLTAASGEEELVRDSDLVVTATGKLPRPVFDRAWLKPGALVLPVHAMGWNHDAPHTFDKLFADDWPQLCSFVGGDGGYHHPMPERPTAQLGEVIAGTHPGRESDDETIIDYNLGVAIHDVAIGTLLLKRARAKGVGTELPL